MKKRFYISGYEITIREIILSVSIIAIMVLFGMFIHNGIVERNISKNEIYNKAIKISDADLFQYAMETNVGNAFVNGVLKAESTVTYPEIGGGYMRIEKIKERYTMHTRVETYTTGSGKNAQVHTRVVTYWTWDRVGAESKTSDKISFCGTIFNQNKIAVPSTYYLKTIKESSHIRYKYYVTDKEHNGTIFAELKDGTIPDNTGFHRGKTIEETIESLKTSTTVGIVFFWIFWFILIAGCVVGFYCLENKWLK